jgi:N4-gp56 family major capsid protein
MADTIISTANEVKQWDNDVFLEYTRENQFFPYMGTSENSAIQVDENLIKKPGDAVTLSLIGRMTNNNVGSGTLEGNEEALGNYGHQIEIGVIRNAFTVDNFEDQSTGIDIRNAGRTQLKNWNMDLLRNDILQALHSRNGTNYGDAAAAAHDTWNDDNLDRLIYVGTTAAGDHTTQLATLTAGTDTLSSTVVSLARRKARTATPKMKPIRVNGQEEWFVMFCDPYAMRDLRADTVIQAAQRDALARGQNNPLFRAGDIIWDGVICREVPEIASFIDDADNGVWGANSTADSLATAGASSARVGVSFMLGAQAVGVAYGKRMVTTTDTREYGFVKGFGCEEFRGVEKLLYQTQTGKTNATDHGVVTVYTASALD